MNVLLTGGRVIDPSQGLDAENDVLVEDGAVSKIGSRIKAPAGIEKIDARGLVVAPGFIDLHTHLREPGQEHKETIATGTRAAVAGGFTAICAMANTEPPNDERSVTELIVNEARRKGACRVYPIGAVSRGLAGEAMAELADLRAAGCVGFSDDGRPVSNSLLMRRALEYAKMLGVPIITHSEDLDLAGSGSMHEGYYSTLLGLRGIPAASEEVMIARDVILAMMTGGHLHVGHISTRGGVDAVRDGKAKGVHVTCEVTPHHVALTDERLRSFSTDLKMKPPLRSEEHRQAVVDAIADGTIDAIATDHAPHHPDEKGVEFDLAPNGIIGLETAFAVCHAALVESGAIGLPRLIELMSSGPARIFSLPGGTLRSGAPADVVLLDPAAEYEYDEVRSRSKNSPWLGTRLRGRAVATFVGGELRHDARQDAAGGAKRRERAKR
jgi:dihydroorotase